MATSQTPSAAWCFPFPLDPVQSPGDERLGVGRAHSLLEAWVLITSSLIWPIRNSKYPSQGVQSSSGFTSGLKCCQLVKKQNKKSSVVYLSGNKNWSFPLGTEVSCGSLAEDPWEEYMRLLETFSPFFLCVILWVFFSFISYSCGSQCTNQYNHSSVLI